MGKVIHIRFHEDLGQEESPQLARLLNRLRYNMEMAVWRAKNRAARPDPHDPSTWDCEALDRLDREYEMVGLP